MQLRSKVVGIILAGFLLYGVVELCIQRFIVFPSFVSLEREEAAKDSMRVSLAIQERLRHLNALCHDWAAWDDTYEYTVNKSKTYEQSNLINSSFYDNHLNLIQIYDSKGKAVWGKILDLETGTPFPLAEFQNGSPPPSLLPQQKKGQPPSEMVISGIVVTEKGPMLISSRPILRGDNTGPIRGTLIMGTLLTEKVKKNLEAQTKLDFHILPVHSSPPEDSVQVILNRFKNDSACLIEEATPGFLTVYGKYKDISGKVGFLTRALVPRTITALGNTTVYHAIYSALITMVIILLAALIFINRSVLRPIRRFTEHVMRVGKSGDLSERLQITGGGEIETLSVEFNNMLESLANTKGKLTEQTHSNDLLKNEIDGHKRYEAALRKYRSIIASSSDHIILIDGDFRFMVVNDSLLRAHNLTREEVIGDHLTKLMDKTTFENDLKERLERCLSGETVRFNAWFTFPTLGRRWMDISCFPFIENNATSGVVIHARDMTESKLMEEHLFKAQKMDAVGTLAGGIAHDFNNILMGISGRISLMMFDSDTSSPNHIHLKEMDKYVNSASTLTRQLLGYARGGKNEIKPIDMNQLIQSNSGMFGRTSRGVNIQTRLEKELWPVNADRSQLDQVLLNLYMNAGQAMPEGGDLLIVSRNVFLDEDFVIPYPEPPGRYVEVSVTDTGIGMDQATKKRIFEPFFTTKRLGDRKGTGLGLASAYGIIKNHNGIIEVSSQKGEGTTFRIYLPASARAAAEEEAHHATPALKGDETVLVIDDEAFITDITKQFLLMLGYKVITAHSGEKGIEVFTKHREEIAVVILDLVMPGMGGEETYVKLKTLDPGVRVLLTSGCDLRGKAIEIMKEGCNGFIQKPIRLEDLSRKLREIIDKRKMSSPTDRLSQAG